VLEDDICFMQEQIKGLIQWMHRIIRERLHYKSEDLPYYLTIFVAFVFFVAGLNAFIDLTEELVENELTQFDEYVTGLVLSYRNERLTPIFLFATHLGSRNGYFVIIGALTLYFILRHKSWRFVLQTVTVLLLSTLSNIVLKKAINRARPSLEHLVEVYTLSYPSGHAMSAMGFYGFLIFLTLRFSMPLYLKSVLVAVLGVLILAIGISRIYLGVHYPSDVLAGFIGGIIWVAFCAIIFDVVDLWRKRKRRIRELNHLDTNKTT
jgi:membrane-associated phospholipid phosphatase